MAIFDFECDKDGYNKDDFDRDGYNRAGYDRLGYNRAGFDRSGYNHIGYNHAGYSKTGYNEKNVPENAFPQSFSDYDSVIFVDTETSGLDPEISQIIEIAVIILKKAERFKISFTYDKLIRLEGAAALDSKITELTGITTKLLTEKGIAKEQVAKELSQIIQDEKVLLVAYNAQFDIQFLEKFFEGSSIAYRMDKWDYLDALTVYKDRRPYPHKLKNAICAYHLEQKVCNTHRAIDDTYATVCVLMSMVQEKNDVNRYINLFGYNPKWGVNGRRLKRIKYVAQPYGQKDKLYERGMRDTRNNSACNYPFKIEALPELTVIDESTLRFLRVGIELGNRDCEFSYLVHLIAEDEELYNRNPDKYQVLIQPDSLKQLVKKIVSSSVYERITQEVLVVNSVTRISKCIDMLVNYFEKYKDEKAKKEVADTYLGLINSANSFVRKKPGLPGYAN